jgi:ligand-binding SRPBCC domain-containing protein
MIDASIERTFDLSLDLDLHAASMARSGERAVGGRRSGRIGHGEEVTWRARHFGAWWTMTSRITEYERPTRFVDEQVRGPFAMFRHAHRFPDAGSTTEMIDEVWFEAPIPVVGRVGERILLERYVGRLIDRRNAHLAATAERR